MQISHKSFTADINVIDSNGGKKYFGYIKSSNAANAFQYKMPFKSTNIEDVKVEFVSFVDTLSAQQTKVEHIAVDDDINSFVSPNLKQEMEKTKQSKIYKDAMKKIDAMKDFVDTNMKEWGEKKAIDALFLKLKGLIEGAIFRRRDKL